MENLFKSIMSGIIIGIGGIVYLSCDIKYIGAFLFSIGLLSICEFGLELYTGKVGYIFIHKNGYYKSVLHALFGNIIGTFVSGVLTSFIKPEIAQKAFEICNLKLLQNPLQTIILAFFCGMLMFIAVYVYNNNSGFSKFIGIFIAVPVFILSGFEHSIANMFYFFSAGIVNVSMFTFIICCVIGNALGAFTIAYFNNK